MMSLVRVSISYDLLNMRLLYTFLLFSGILNLNGQKYDYYWLFGQKTAPTHDKQGGTDIFFDSLNLSIYKIDREIEFGPDNISICDRNGNFMFASNGIVIVGKDYNIIENGEGLNPGEVYDSWKNYSYPCAQCMVVLPHFNQDSLYNLIHLRVLRNAYSSADLMLHTEIDMRQNNGKGKVTKKNEVILQDSMTYGNLSAVKHGNGRDWWIFQPERATNGHRMVLFTPEGFQPALRQEAGPVYGDLEGLGQAAFSPDGTKYARYEYFHDLHLYDFDRCTGLLSNHRAVEIRDNADTFRLAGGLAFSPNSRFLYVSSFNHLYQFDTEAPDLAVSKILVGIYDGFQSPYSTYFFMQQLGPDGKIYMSAPNGVNMLHVIHRPDSLGQACDFEQHGIITPTYIIYGMPHFPNYRLGAWEGSHCDTIKLTPPPPPTDTVSCERAGEVFPNPAGEAFTLVFCLEMQESAELRLLDVSGRLISLQLLAGGNRTHLISTQGLPAGVYLFTIRQNGKVIHTGKIVKTG
jgi:hypothetical protein